MYAGLIMNSKRDGIQLHHNRINSFESFHANIHWWNIYWSIFRLVWNTNVRFYRQPNSLISFLYVRNSNLKLCYKLTKLNQSLAVRTITNVRNGFMFVSVSTTKIQDMVKARNTFVSAVLMRTDRFYRPTLSIYYWYICI